MNDDLVRGATALDRHSGPFTTVYLPAPSAQPNASELLHLRWKNLARTLERRRASRETSRPSTTLHLGVTQEATLSS